MTQALAK